MATTIQVEHSRIGAQDSSKRDGRVESSSLLTLLRYAMNCAVVLAVKLGLTWLLCLLLNAPAAYLAVHILVFFVSYAIHLLMTFQAKFSWNSMRRYFAAVVLFKILDLAVFNVLFARWSVAPLWCVLIASLSVLIVRFTVVRIAFKPQQANRVVTHA